MFMFYGETISLINLEPYDRKKNILKKCLIYWCNYSHYPLILSINFSCKADTMHISIQHLRSINVNILTESICNVSKTEKSSVPLSDLCKVFWDELLGTHITF